MSQTAMRRQPLRPIACRRTAPSTVNAVGNITLAGLHAPSGTVRKAIDADLSGFHGTPTAASADLTLTSTGDNGTATVGSVSAAALQSTGNLTINAVSSAAVTNVVTIGDGLTAPNSGNFNVTVTKGPLTLGGTGVVQSATGTIALAASGPIAVDTLLAGGAIMVRSSNDAAVLTYGSAARGDIDVAGLTAATITQGTATLGNVRASAASGLATIGDATAGQSVIANGPSAVVTTAKAGDDIVLVGGSGDVTATTLTVTGAAATETPAADANGNPLMFGGVTLTGLGSGGSNVIIRATGTATIGGDVSIAQSNAAKTADYDVRAGSITLGTTGMALNQAAAGRVDLVSTTGGVTFANTGGTLSSNVGGMRIASADASTAAAGLSIASATGIAGAGTALVAAQTADASAGPDRQLRQPGIVLSAAPGGNGSVAIGSITGGAVTVTAPGTIAITGLSGGPGITATGDVSLTGVATAGNDTAIIAPVAIVIDGVNPTSSYGRVNVTAAGGGTVGGPGAEIASLGVVNGGQVGALQVLSDTGAATLRATPTDPARIASILVESQTGTAGILAPGGGAVTVAAQTITLRGRQNGSIVLANEPLLATGSVLATGPTVTLGTVQINGTAADGTGDLVVAATGAASLAAAASETAVARHSLTVTGGTVVLGDGTATGGTLALGGTNGVTIARRAVAGDDLVVTSGGSVVATNAALTTTGSTDLQGDDNAGLTTATVGTFPAGAGYGLKYGSVLADVAAPVYDTATAGALNHLFNSNIVVTAANNIDLGVATLTATAGRDIHVEAGGTINLSSASAARQFVGYSAGTFTATGSVTAGDDVVLGSGAGIDVHSAVLGTTGGAASATDARRADGTLLTVAAAGGALSNLAGSNIALAAAGPIQLGAVATSVAPSSLRAFSGGAITTTGPIATSGSAVLVGTTVTDNFALTAGDDIVAIARGGAATLNGTLTTSGTAASNAALVDLAGNGIALPGEADLGRVDGSSILVAATGVSTVSGNVLSAGRYTVDGRSGIALGTATAMAPGSSQTAAGDILLQASTGAAPLPASINLAANMVLTANSDASEAPLGGGRYVPENLVVSLGNGSLNAGAATLAVDRTANAPLADQGTVQVQPATMGVVTSINIQTLDSASADLRAVNAVTIGSARVDAGLTLASQKDAVSLTTLTVGTAVPMMTTAQVNAIDVKLSGAMGASLGTVTTGANLVRDITVATVGGDASLTTASARDDIVVASATGRAIAGNLTFAGTASDSSAVTATDANGVALPDPYGFTGPTITGLSGRNIVVSGATAASLNSVTTAASDSLGDVRVLTAAGPATLTTVSAGGAGLPTRVIVATRNGTATGTTLNASGDIIVDATAGSAVLTTGNAGRDGIVVAPTVMIGTLTAGDDVVAVATGGTLTAGTLTSSGSNSGDGIATVFRADGTSIVDPVAGGVVGNLAGGNVVALATGNVTVTTATVTAAPGAVPPGLVRLGSAGGSVITTTAASAGDIALTGNSITTTTISAGRDISLNTLGAPLMGPAGNGMITASRVTAGRDLTINARSADFTGGGSGLIAAQRNLNVFTAGPLMIATARAGGMLVATADTLTATRLESGDAMTVLTRVGDATIGTAASTGHGLLTDFTGFDPTSTAPGSTRNISVTAQGTANVTTATAVGNLTLAGQTTTLGSGSAAFITDTAGSGGATVTAATAGQDLTVNSGGTASVLQASAGRDALINATGLATLPQLTAGRDVTITAGSATLASGTGLVAAQRNVAVTTAQGLTIGTARAGGTLSATGMAVTATTLGAGDALTVRATAGDATIGAASSTGLPLLADFTGFAATGAAPGATRDVGITAIGGAANVGTANAVDTITVAGGTSASVTSATANFVNVTGGTGGATVTAASAGEDLTIGSGGAATVQQASVGRDATITASGPATLLQLKAGRDIAVSAGSANLANTAGGLIGAQRNIAVTTSGVLNVATARAGGTLSLTGSAVSAGTVAAGDAVTVQATQSDATVASAASTGLPLLGDFSGFATSGTAPGSTRNITITAAGGAVLSVGNAVGTLSLTGATASLGHGTADFIAVTARTGEADVTASAARDDLTVSAGGAASVASTTAGRDATVSAGGAATVFLTAGRDLSVTAGSAMLGTAGGLVAAQRNLMATTSGALLIGTARAGGTLSATGASVTATTLGAGDALTVVARSGDASVTTAASTGQPLLADFSGFAPTGTAPGMTRDISVSATGAATLTNSAAFHSISVAGTSATATTATANTGGTDGDLAVTATNGVALLGTGSARDIRVTATGSGSATATTAIATRDLYVDAPGVAGTLATATVTTGSAGRDAVINGQSVMIGTLTAADDLVAVATGGSLTGTTLTSTGANSGDGIATISRANGSAVLDPTVTGTPAVGNLAGGNVVALASGDLTVGTVTATAAPAATIPGLVRLASLGTTTVTAATATAGDVVVAGRAVSGNTLTAGRDATVTATAGDVQLATVGSGRSLMLTAANDVAVAGTATATGGPATITAGRDINLAATATRDALDTAGNATLMAGRSIVVARPVVVGAALAATAGGAASFAGTTSGGATTIAAQGPLTLTVDTTAGGPLMLSSAGGGITAPNISGNGITLAAGTAVNVAGATTSTGGLSATGGSLGFGSISTTADVALHATGGLSVSGTTSSGGALTATSDSGAIQMAATTTGGPATITAGDANNGTIVLASLGTTGAATLLAGQSATVTHLAQTSGALTATATNAGLSFGAIDSGAAATLRARTAIAVAGLARAAGALDVLSSAGSVNLGSAQAAMITLRGASGVTVSNGTTASGPVTLTADTGAVTTGDISTTGATNVTATTGAVTLASVSQTAALTVAAATAATVTGDIHASSDVGVTASGGPATIGSISSAGKLSATGAQGVAITGGTIAAGPVTLTAGSGSVATGDIASGGATNVTATTGAITLASVSRTAALTLAAATDATVTGDVEAGGDVGVTAAKGMATIGSVGSAGKLTVTGGTGVTIVHGSAASGPVTLVAGSGPVVTGDIAAGGSTSVTAMNGAVTLASVSKTTALTITASTDAKVAGAIAASGDTQITATTGTATIGGAVKTAKLTVIGGTDAALQSAVTASGDYAVTAPTIELGANGGTQSTTGTLTLASSRLTLGAAAILGAAQRLQLNVVGNASGVVLGGPNAVVAGKYALAKADLAKLSTPTLEINAGALPVDFYDAALPNVTSASTSTGAAFAVRTTSDISLHDRLLFDSTGAGLPRVLTLGGAAGGADLDKTTPTANAIKVLAVPGLNNSTTGTGGQIDAPGSTVQLRATYIALGETPSPAVGQPFIDALLPTGGTPLTTALTRTNYVNNASSSLYVAIPPYAIQTPAPQALVQAGTLVLAPGQWALIQNTGPTTTPGGGVLATTLKFNKVAGAAAADPEIAVFGSINGKTGVASAISIDAGNLDGISPNNIRVNGCVALSTAGCIQSAVSIPLINLADPGRTLLISTAPDLALSVELITGATNEALWREDDDAPGQNRPQRESRP